VVAFQPWIQKGEQSGLQTRTATARFRM